MKIALIHYRLLRKGGLETRLFNYLHYFLKRGDDVTLVYAKKGAGVSVPSTVKEIQVNIKFIPKPLREYYFMLRLSPIMKSSSFDFSLSMGRTKDQQVVLCPGNHRGYLRALGIKNKLPLDVMEDHLDVLAFRNSQLVLAASEMIKDELISLYHVPESKVKVLYPPLNTAKFFREASLDKIHLRRQFKLPEYAKLFLFVSVSHKRKGLDLLLKVFQKLRNMPVMLVIAGDKVSQTNLPPNIRQMGFVEDLQQLYNTVDYTIHPARYEPFGQVVSESLQCGTPVIVSKMTGAKELLDEKTGVVVEDFDEESWKKAVVQALKKQLFVPKDFAKEKEVTLDHHMKRMLGLYKEIG